MSEADGLSISTVGSSFERPITVIFMTLTKSMLQGGYHQPQNNPGRGLVGVDRPNIEQDVMRNLAEEKH